MVIVTVKMVTIIMEPILFVFNVQLDMKLVLMQLLELNAKDKIEHLLYLIVHVKISTMMTI